MSFEVKCIKLTKSKGIVQLPTMLATEGIQLKANRNNEDSIYIAPNQGSFSGYDESFPLDAIDSILMLVRNANEIWARTDSEKEVRLHILAASR